MPPGATRPQHWSVCPLCRSCMVGGMDNEWLRLWRHYGLLYRELMEGDMAPTRPCELCGRVMTRMEGGAYIGGKRVWFCHPDDPTLPDCYSQVTRGRVYQEGIGTLPRRQEAEALHGELYPAS